MPLLTAVNAGLPMKGYKELLFKLKTQRRQLQHAANQQHNFPTFPSAAPANSGTLLQYRVVTGNTVLARFKTYLLQQRGALFASIQSARSQSDLSSSVSPASSSSTSTSSSASTSTSSSPPPSSASSTPSTSSSNVFRENNEWEQFLEPIVTGVVGCAGRTLMMLANQTTVIGGDRLLQAIKHRPNNQGLLTVSNHVAAMDDPLVLTAILPWSNILDSDTLRWTMCATDRCFKYNSFVNSFFKAGKVLPMERGAGLSQWGMQSAEAKLAQGDWVHVFPEGTRSLDREVKPAKRGVGRLMFGAWQEGIKQQAQEQDKKEDLTIPGGVQPTPPQPVLPMLLPIVHLGMEDIMPKGSKIPRVGKKVSVLVGEPIVVDDLLHAHQMGQFSTMELYNHIAERVGGTLQEMHAHLKASQDLMDEAATLDTLTNCTKQLEVDSLASHSQRNDSIPPEAAMNYAPGGVSCQMFAPSRGFAAGSVFDKVKAKTHKKVTSYGINVRHGLPIESESFLKRMLAL